MSLRHILYEDVSYVEREKALIFSPLSGKEAVVTFSQIRSKNCKP